MNPIANAITKSASVIAKVVSSFFDWRVASIEDREDKYEDKSIYWADTMCENIDKLKPLLITGDKKKKLIIQRLYEAREKYRHYRKHC